MRNAAHRLCGPGIAVCVLLAFATQTVPAGAQRSGYRLIEGVTQSCSPPVCTTQSYDSWGFDLTPTFHFVTHNFSPGGASGMHWTSTPYFQNDLLGGGELVPRIAGDDVFEAGHAFHILSLYGPALGCPFGHIAGASNTQLNYTTIDHPALNGNAAARLLITPITFEPVIHEHFGVWYNTAAERWNIFIQDTAAFLPNGTQFLVLPSTCLVDVLFPAVHVASAGNIVGAATVIDDPAINGRPSELLLVTQVWDESSMVYNDNPVGVYFDAASQRWRIYNDGGAAMPVGARFFWARVQVVHHNNFETGNSLGWDYFSP